jgi:phosphatidylglycerophosphatase A
MNADRWAARAISTWFGCGYWPWGPGTAGSAAAVLIACAVPWSPLQAGVAALIVTLPGVWASDTEASNCGRKDPGHIVVDEVAGQWITIAGASSVTWKSALAAFVVFRLLDIWKPVPARQLERLPGGFGIMADDVMAGLYGAFVLYILGC